VVTLRDVRRGVGDDAGEMFLLEATDASSLNTIIDEVHLADRSDNTASLLNRILYFSGGTAANLGHEARTTAFQHSTSTLAFRPDAPSIPQPGDEVELWTNWTRFGGISAIHRMIARGIRAVGSVAGDEVWDDAVAFDRTSPSITIPTTWHELGGMEIQRTDGTWRTVRREDVIPRRGLREIQLKGVGAYKANRGYVRLWGYTKAAVPLQDDDIITVDEEWLVQNVVAALRLGSSWRASDRQAEERLASFWAGKAAELRRKVGNATNGWGIRFPVTEE
jgi:hypothetical protein